MGGNGFKLKEKKRQNVSSKHEYNKQFREVMPGYL